MRLDDIIEVGKRHREHAELLAGAIKSARAEGLIPDVTALLEEMGLVRCETMYRCQDCGRVVVDENRDKPHRYTMEVGKEDPCRATGWVPFRVSYDEHPLTPYLPMTGRPG